MDIARHLRHLPASTIRPRSLMGAILAVYATSAAARAPTALPEPSALSLLGIGVVAAIVAYRLNKRK